MKNAFLTLLNYIRYYNFLLLFRNVKNQYKLKKKCLYYIAITSLLLLFIICFEFHLYCNYTNYTNIEKTILRIECIQDSTMHMLFARFDVVLPVLANSS